MCYCTDEGTGSEEGGTVTGVDLFTGTEVLIKDQMQGADGAWFDQTNSILYFGKLSTIEILVFDASSDHCQFVANFAGLSSLLDSI
jgi:sugar lactone lactonase YvrE